MSSTITVVILYPRKAGVTFNLSHYLQHHVPLVSKHWAKYGVVVRSITGGNPDGEYDLVTVLGWESMDKYEAAQRDEGTKEITADITSGNFTTAAPVFIVGKSVE